MLIGSGSCQSRLEQADIQWVEGSSKEMEPHCDGIGMATWMCPLCNVEYTYCIDKQIAIGHRVIEMMQCAASPCGLPFSSLQSLAVVILLGCDYTTE